MSVKTELEVMYKEAKSFVEAYELGLEEHILDCLIDKTEDVFCAIFGVSELEDLPLNSDKTSYDLDLIYSTCALLEDKLEGMFKVKGQMEDQ